MKLTIPTWVVFLFLGIASFAPVVSLQPRWWAPYYGALLVCWVLVAVATIRQVAREERRSKRDLARMLRQLQDAKEAAAGVTDADVVRHTLVEERLIIVSHDGMDLYDHIRRGQSNNESVKVIRDRRRTDRRLRMEAHTPDRRRGERRRYDIAPLLRTQGWVEVTSPGD